MNWDRIEGNWKQLADNVKRQPKRRPGDPDRDAEHRWENEGGNRPLTEPPDANPRKHL